jgi:hypothetical protein
MPALREPLNLGDLLKYEEETLRYSRDPVTVAAGESLELGAVVGRVTANTKIKRFDPAAADGTETPVGILLGEVDASLTDVPDGIILARHGIVASGAVVWPEGLTVPQQAAAIAALEAKGILIRQSA